MAITEVGHIRDDNEDHYACEPPLHLYVVADGMGGCSSGDIASKLATSSIVTSFRNSVQSNDKWPDGYDRGKPLGYNRALSSVTIANTAVFRAAKSTNHLMGIGTTVVLLHYDPCDNFVFIAHVGDSRCYQIRNGEVRLLTRDHSLINEYEAYFPSLTQQQRDELPRNVITRAVGIQESINVDLRIEEGILGDQYLLCTDGFWQEIDPLLAGVVGSTRDRRLLLPKLMDRVLLGDATDNATGLLVEFIEQSTQEECDDWLEKMVISVFLIFYWYFSTETLRLECWVLQTGSKVVEPEQKHLASDRQAMTRGLFQFGNTATR